MIDLDDREAGFYWISVGGQAAEVALWHLEWTSWLVVGQDQPLTDDASHRCTGPQRLPGATAKLR